MSYPFLIMSNKMDNKYLTREDFREMREYQQFLEKRIKLLSKEHNQMLQIIVNITDTVFGKDWRNFKGEYRGGRNW